MPIIFSFYFINLAKVHHRSLIIITIILEHHSLILLCLPNMEPLFFLFMVIVLHFLGLCWQVGSNSVEEVDLI